MFRSRAGFSLYRLPDSNLGLVCSSLAVCTQRDATWGSLERSSHVVAGRDLGIPLIASEGHRVSHLYSGGCVVENL